MCFSTLIRPRDNVLQHLVGRDPASLSQLLFQDGADAVELIRIARGSLTLSIMQSFRELA